MNKKSLVLGAAMIAVIAGFCGHAAFAAEPLSTCQINSVIVDCNDSNHKHHGHDHDIFMRACSETLNKVTDSTPPLVFTVDQIKAVSAACNDSKHSEGQHDHAKVMSDCAATVEKVTTVEKK